jgi:dipeptidyl aminopeptidase/acylaminoacyl peptidase
MRLLLGGRVLLVTLLAVALFAVAALPAGATVSGTNGKILFGQVFPNYGVTINPDGSNPIQIGPVDSTTCDTWSPDSSKVLCNLWSPEGVQPGVQPATANPDGSGFTLLSTNLPLDLFCLNWSPTGARLLCHSEGMANPAEAGLYTARSSDAGDLVRVSTTLPGGFDIGYGYSPDGSRILYAQFDSNDHATLFSVKSDGSDPVQLSPPELSIIDLGFFDRVGADWSPDGSRVVFAAMKPGGRFLSAAFVVNADGTGLRQITPSGIGALSAQWSPNGAMIAFSGGCCGLPQAWVVHPDGSGLRRVTTAVNRDFFVTPVWSPDSTKLLLNKIDRNNQASVWTANLDGSGLVHLADTPQPSILDWGSAPAN